MRNRYIRPSIEYEETRKLRIHEDETGGRVTFNPLEEDSLFKDLIKFFIKSTCFFIP